MEVVVDANVLVSAAATPDGTCGRLLDALAQSPVQLVVSATVLAEVDGVLARPRFSAIPATTRERFVTWLRHAALVVDDPPPTIAVPTLEDASDAYLVRLTLASPGRLLVTGDRHLLDHADVLPVVPPADLLAALEAMRAQP